MVYVIKGWLSFINRKNPYDITAFFFQSRDERNYARHQTAIKRRCRDYTCFTHKDDGIHSSGFLLVTETIVLTRSQLDCVDIYIQTCVLGGFSRLRTYIDCGICSVFSHSIFNKEIIWVWFTSAPPLLLRKDWNTTNNCPGRTGGRLFINYLVGMFICLCHAEITSIKCRSIHV